MKALKPVEKKPGTRYIKLGSHAIGQQKTHEGWKTAGWRTLYAFIDAKGISFRVTQKVGKEFATIKSLRLSVKTLKDGTIKFQFYRLRANSVRCCDPKALRDLLTLANNYKRIPKTQTKRLLQLIHIFCREHQYSVTGLSKDPINLLIQLCYPGTRGLDESILSDLSLGKYFFDDPIKLVLNTHGKYSKRLIMQVIKEHPCSVQTIFRLAHYLRTTRSLDAAQVFLASILNAQPERRNPYIRAGQRIVMFPDDYMNITIREEIEEPVYLVPSKQKSFANLRSHALTVFDRTSPAEIAQTLVNNHSFVRDTVQFYLQCKQMGFDMSTIPMTSLQEIHDHCHREIGKAQKSASIKPVVFDPEQVNMVIGQAMCDQFNAANTDLVAVIPYDKATVVQFGDAMHNCASGYSHLIRTNQYIIVVIKENGKCKYMLGFNHSIRHQRMITISLEQFVTHCNQSVPIDIQTDIISALCKPLDIDQLSVTFAPHSFHFDQVI
jgi:hypothetical protein